jgi:two-component system cell cycle response regulator
VDYHVVLTNDKVGGEDALRLCSQLRAQEKTRNSPILLMIAAGDNARLAKALELGVNDYLLRPIEGDELIARVRTQVRQRLLDDRLRATYAQNLTAAVTDRLTGLNNRHYLEAHFVAVARRLEGVGKPISVLMLDLDRFKSVNDTHGHTVGDEVLKGLAGRIVGNLRTMDTAVRYGGEEFLVLMPEVTLPEATAAAERLRHAVAEQPFPAAVPGGGIAATVSIGVAFGIAGAASLQDLVKAADSALYEAKRDGRNRVTAAGADSPIATPAAPRAAVA